MLRASRRVLFSMRRTKPAYAAPGDARATAAPMQPGARLLTKIIVASRENLPMVTLSLFALGNMIYWLGHESLNPNYDPHHTLDASKGVINTTDPEYAKAYSHNPVKDYVQTHDLPLAFSGHRDRAHPKPLIPENVEKQ
eukprot:g54700.t1